MFFNFWFRNFAEYLHLSKFNSKSLVRDLQELVDINIIHAGEEEKVKNFIITHAKPGDIVLFIGAGDSNLIARKLFNCLENIL